MSRRALLLAVSLLTASCFGTPRASPDGPDRALPQALQVEDPEGAAFSQDEIPRDPRLALSFERQVPTNPEQALALLAGVFEAPFVARLANLRSGSNYKARTRALMVTQGARSASVQPLAALEPGARYSLAWFAGDASTAFALRVSDDPSQGARLIESFPGDGERAAPSALARALLRFDGRVRTLASQVSLLGPDGSAVAADVELQPCEDTGFAPGDCAWLTPAMPLAPGSYQLALGAGASTDTGAPLAAVQFTFTVSASAIAAPPSFQGLACALDEIAQQSLCLRVEDQTLLVRGALATAALVTLSGATPPVSALSFAGGFTLALPLVDGQRSALLTATNLAGQQSMLTLTFDLPSPLAQLTIDELRADPLGEEPAQEYVELLNFGPTPVSLMGFSLSRDEHDRGRTITSSASLDAGGRALVVAPSFDPRDASDGVLPGGVTLIYLDGALSLANGGDQLFLRDALGRRLAGARSFAGIVEGQCTARYRDADASASLGERSDDPRAFELDPLGGCTPGSATFPRP